MTPAKMSRLNSVGISHLRNKDSLLKSKRILLQSPSADECGDSSNHVTGSISRTNQNNGVWRLSEDGTMWCFRKLIAENDFLYILSSSKSRGEQIVDKISMSSIHDVTLCESDSHTSNSYCAAPTPIQVHLSKLASTDKEHSLHGIFEYRNFENGAIPAYSTTLVPIRAIHTFEFTVTSTAPKQKSKKSKSYTKSLSFKRDPTLDKKYIFHAGTDAEAHSRCDEWVRILKQASASAKIRATRQKNRRWLQGGLRRAYEQSPFQVRRSPKFLKHDLDSAAVLCPKSAAACFFV